MLTTTYKCMTVSFLLVSCYQLHTQAVPTNFQGNKSCQTFVNIYSKTAEGNFTFVSQNAFLSFLIFPHYFLPLLGILFFSNASPLH